MGAGKTSDGFRWSPSRFYADNQNCSLTCEQQKIRPYKMWLANQTSRHIQIQSLEYKKFISLRLTCTQCPSDLYKMLFSAHNTSRCELPFTQRIQGSLLHHSLLTSSSVSPVRLCNVTATHAFSLGPMSCHYEL